MNLRWVHALLILLSAALAVLFGVWCLGLYGREDGVASLLAAIAAFAAVVRPGRLRLVVPAQDEDAAMKPERSLRLGIATGLDDGGGRGDRRQLERLRLSGVLRGGGDLDDRRDEARRPGDAGHHACGAGRVRGLLSLSPQAREAHRGRRARHRMVGAPKAVENIMTDWLGLPALASAHGGQIDNLIGWMHVFMLILFVGWGGFFALRPGPFPAIAESGGGLHGGHVAHVELSRDRRGRGRSDSPVRIRDPALGREGRPHAPGERGAGRSGHRRAVRLERPLCRPRRGIRPHGHQADRPPVEPPGTRSLRSCREGRRHDASISSICP